MRNSKTLGSLCALLATIIWSGNFVVARGLGDMLPPITLSVLRWTTATTVLLPFALPAMWRERDVIRRHFKLLALTAFLSVSVFNSLIYIAAHTTGAINMALIATTTPVFVVLLSRIFLGEPITRFRALGLVVAIAGVVTLVTRADLSVLRDLSFHVGDFWMLAAGFLWAVYSIMIKRKPKEISPRIYLGSTFLLGLVPLIPAAIVEQTLAPQWTMSSQVVIGVLYVGVGASLISYMLWTLAVGMVGPTTSSFIYYSLPVFSAISAYFVLGEQVTLAHVVGFALILSGILMATLPRFNPQHAKLK